MHARCPLRHCAQSTSPHCSVDISGKIGMFSPQIGASFPKPYLAITSDKSVLLPSRWQAISKALPFSSFEIDLAP